MAPPPTGEVSPLAEAACRRAPRVTVRVIPFGRSPGFAGQRFDRAFPVSQWHMRHRSPLTVAGAAAIFTAFLFIRV